MTGPRIPQTEGLSHVVQLRVHIELDAASVAQIDQMAGPGGRMTLVRTAIERSVRQTQRWRSLQSAAGALVGEAHEGNIDAAAWVREQRHGNPRTRSAGPRWPAVDNFGANPS